MTLRIHRLLQPGLLELSEADRRRLMGLEKRVECLVQPLNYLLLWSKKQDSCVQQVVLNAQELLFDVCTFIERFVPQDPAQAGGKGGGGGAGLDSEQLEYYLRELEFACTSVGMAVNIARATEPPPPQQLARPLEGGASSSGVSLSAVLRASRRIQEMHGRSGDLCTCPGRLYAQACSSRAPAPLDTPAGSAEGADCTTGEPVRDIMWAPVLSLATLKVVSAVDPRLRDRRYCLSVESRLPLNQRDTPLPPSASSSSLPGSGDPEEPRVGGMNSSGPLNFPIEVALDSCLATSGSVALPTETARSSGLGIDSLALVWQAACSGTGFGNGADDAGTEFPDAVFLQEGPTTSSVGSRSLRASTSRVRSANSGNVAHGAANATRYAFMFDAPRGTAEPRSDEMVLTPLDTMYLARLCALDDGLQQPYGQDSGPEAASCPPHLLTSDEVLMALLLQDEVCGVTCEDAGTGGQRTARQVQAAFGGKLEGEPSGMADATPSTLEKSQA